jgi:hypothetical protein
MKKIVLIAASIFSVAMAFAQKKVADVAKFNTETIDFGKIKQGVPQKGTFIVTNIGTEPLIIEQANPTCGCTISDYTKEPIAPGKTGFINATYNAASLNHFDKHLTVKFAGIDEVKSISFTGDVVAAEEFDKLSTDKTKAAVAAPAAAPAKTSTAKPTIKKAKTKTKK